MGACFCWHAHCLSSDGQDPLEALFSQELPQTIPHVFDDSAPRTLRFLNTPPVAPTFVLTGVLGLLGLIWFSLTCLRTIALIRGAEQDTDEERVSVLVEVGHQYGLSDVPVVKRSDSIRSPCLWGFANPVVLIPTSLEPDTAATRLVFEHELAHLKFKDHFWIALQTMIAHMLWWFPPIWFGLRQSVLAREQRVDSLVGFRPDYVSLLAGYAAPAAKLNLTSLIGGGQLLKRIRALRTSMDVRGHWGHTLAAFAPLLATIPVDLVPRSNQEDQGIGLDEIVYNSGGRLWRMSMHGLHQRPLPALFKGVGVPSVSPDGKWLAYNRSVNGKEDIYVARVDGTGERCIVSSPARDVQPRWSPDGTNIIFCTLASGSWEIGLSVVDSGEWSFVTNDGKKNLEADWHPSGERIVFSSHRTGAQKLWSMSLDGSNLKQLTFGKWEDTHGRYSPDGRLLAYSSNRRIVHRSVVQDLQTGVVVPLTGAPIIDSGEVEFSADGEYLAMTAQLGHRAAIARVSVRDFRLRLLTRENSAIWPTMRQILHKP